MGGRYPWILITINIVVACSANAIYKKYSSEGPVVRIKGQGLVRGTLAEDGEYYQYFGIPYATASAADRFKSPLPIPSWEGIREATKDDETIACPQFGYITGGVVGQEDCLIVNVYTPVSRPPLNKLPVMVFLHGGGFNAGNGQKSVYGPRRITEEGVILITFNYRLGIFGFLCTGDTANAGLKDAVAVLEWVQTNIEAFGGDPKKVTLFGESSGSASVEMLALSKRTTGLFSGVIAQSGLTSAPWAFGSNPDEKARRVAEKLGYSGQDREQIMRVLKNASINDLVTFTDNLALMTPFEFLAISPCIEPSTNPGAIITEDPIKTILTRNYNQVPFVQGFNKDEGMLIYGIEGFASMVRDDFIHMLPTDLQTHAEAQKIADSVKKFYFGAKNISEETLLNLVDLSTDTNYMLSSIKSAWRYIKSGRKSPVFMYEFAYDGGLAYYKPLLNISRIPGVCHADEIGYLFTPTGYSSNSTDDHTTAKRLVKLWTNFAKYRNPTPTTSELLPVKWTPVTKSLDYLLIGRNIEMARKPLPNRVDFWASIYKEFLPDWQ